MYFDSLTRPTLYVLMQTWQDFWPQKEGAVYETQMLGSVFIFQWIYRAINYWRITTCLFYRYQLKELLSVLNMISSDIYENNSKIFKRMPASKVWEHCNSIHTLLRWSNKQVSISTIVIGWLSISSSSMGVLWQILISFGRREKMTEPVWVCSY